MIFSKCNSIECALKITFADLCQLPASAMFTGLDDESVFPLIRPMESQVQVDDSVTVADALAGVAPRPTHMDDVSRWPLVS